MHEKKAKLESETTQGNDQKNSIALRQRVQYLYLERGLSKAEIMRQEKLSKRFVLRWAQAVTQETERDGRGWPKGRGRKYSMTELQSRIGSLHQELRSDEQEFFLGATAIQQQWRKRYPDEPVPGLRTIGRVLKELGLVEKKRGRSKGAAAYLCYPEHTLYHGLKGRMLEADFIGSRFLRGSPAPLNFAGFSFKLAPRLRYYERIEAQDADSLLPAIDRFITRFEKPDFIKVDNCLATIGSASGKRNLSRTMAHLLERGITPVFSVPRKPFTQASIEGNNSVFSRNFYRRRQFRDTDDLDQQLGWFNESSRRYTEYSYPEKNNTNDDKAAHTVIFLRQVAADNNNTQLATISVLNEVICLDRSLINYYVMAVWNLKEQKLDVFLEREKLLQLQLSIPFEINKSSLKKLLKNSPLLFGT